MRRRNGRRRGRAVRHARRRHRRSVPVNGDRGAAVASAGYRLYSRVRRHSPRRRWLRVLRRWSSSPPPVSLSHGRSCATRHRLAPTIDRPDTTPHDVKSAPLFARLSVDTAAPGTRDQQAFSQRQPNRRRDRLLQSRIRAVYAVPRQARSQHQRRSREMRSFIHHSS